VADHDGVLARVRSGDPAQRSGVAFRDLPRGLPSSGRVVRPPGCRDGTRSGRARFAPRARARRQWRERSGTNGSGGWRRRPRPAAGYWRGGGRPAPPGGDLSRSAGCRWSRARLPRRWPWSPRAAPV
jgi:hypothetical protein